MYPDTLQGLIVYLTHNSPAGDSLDPIGDEITFGSSDTNLVLCTPKDLKENGFQIPYAHRGTGGRVLLEESIGVSSPLATLQLGAFYGFLPYWIKHLGKDHGFLGSSLGSSDMMFDILSKEVDGGLDQLVKKVKKLVHEGLSRQERELYDCLDAHGRYRLDEFLAKR